MPTLSPSGSSSLSPTGSPNVGFGVQDGPTASPTSGPSITFSPSGSPTVGFGLEELIVCVDQDFHMFLDISNSMTPTIRANIFELFMVLLDIWFDLEDIGQERPNMDVRIEVMGFGSSFRVSSPVDAAWASNGTVIQKKFGELQEVSERGTHTYLVLKDMMNRREEFINGGRIESDGTGLHLIMATDGVPFFVGTRNEKRAALIEAGLSPRGNLASMVVGRILHTEYLRQFKILFPKARIFGFSPVALDSWFIDDTFDMFYYPGGSLASFFYWSRTVVRVACHNAPTPTETPTQFPSTGTPTSRPSRPTKSPTRFPTRRPSTGRPTKPVTLFPTARPSTGRPSKSPTSYPTDRPSKSPTAFPTARPSTTRPSKGPTSFPTNRPSTGYPTAKPTTGSPIIAR